MNAKQRVIPIEEFAKAMLEVDDVFAKRVEGFDERFGPSDYQTISVLAQAQYFCWFEREYERDYLEVCRAIGRGKPTSLFLCRQITPARWNEMNTYVVAVQKWLGLHSIPLPNGVVRAKMEKVSRWLGQLNLEKKALAELFLFQLVDHLLNCDLAKLAGHDVEPDEEEYIDFTEWYRRPDGFFYSEDTKGTFVEECRERVRSEIELFSQAEELIAGILKESQPPCMHRFSRYQDIKLASIGALKWRGNLPSDEEAPKYAATNWFDDASLDGWLAGIPPKSQLQIKIYKALGIPTERKKSMVRDFFYSQRATQGWHWLEKTAEKRGTKAHSIFGASRNPHHKMKD